MLFQNANLLEDIHGDVKFLIASNVRMKILMSLYDGPKKLSHLRDETNIASSTILHGISQLEQRNLVSRRGELSYLSSKGIIVSLKLINLIKTFDALKIHVAFWKDHSLQGIPPHLQRRINVFKKAYVVESTLDNLQKPFTTYLEMLSNVTEMKAALPVCFPRHLDSIKKALSKGGEVKLILTPEIYDTLLERCSKIVISKFIKKGNLEIFIVDNLDVVYVISENFMSLGLFHENGDYDSSKLLMGHDDEMLKWGNEIFEYHLKDSRKVSSKNMEFE